MDPWFGLFISGLIISMIAGAWWATHRDEDIAKLVTGTAGLVAVVMFVMSLFVIIPTRHEGVIVVAGKPGATLHNGFNWKAPWAQVIKYDATLQTERYSSVKDDQGDPFTVHLANGAIGYLDVTYQWRLGDDISGIYRNYPNKSTSDLNGILVYPQVQQALNDQYAQYDPYSALIAQQQAVTAQATGKPPTTVPVNAANTYQVYGKAAAAQVAAAIRSNGLELVSLTIRNINFDAPTQTRLNELAQAIVQTQIALQNEATAQATAAANKLLTQSPPSLAAVIQQCITTTADNIKAGHQYPAGWNCAAIAQLIVSAH